jgi:hypothetical protein
MEHAFDYDFSGVRVHQAGLADTLRVPACACGSDLYFAPDRYRPHDPVGQALLAHELAHVVQQQTGRVANPFGTGVAVLLDPVLEAAADRCAAWAVRGQRVPGFETHSAHPAGASGPAFLLPHAEPRGDGPPRVVQCAGGVDEDNDLSKSMGVPELSWPVIGNARGDGHGSQNPVNRYRKAKGAGMMSLRVGRLAVNTAEIATGASMVHVAGMVAAGASAAAIGATGIGLLAAAPALTLGCSAVNARSAYKTHKHLENLRLIQGQSGDYFCQVLSNAPTANGKPLHDTILREVLPYIIRQKTKKLAKKEFGMLPVVGVATAGVRIAHGISKYGNNKIPGQGLGHVRTFHAEVLAVHLLTAECQLVDAIIRELLSPDELEWMKQPGQTNNRIVGLIKDKMKSF